MEVVTRLGWRLVALAAGSIAAGSVTAALQDEQPPGAVEEIVVTAQKREQSAVEVPIAVTAFDATRIEALRIDDLETIGDFTPGLEINPGENESSPIFSIRGVGSNNVFSNNNPAVAVHLDEIYLFSNALLGVPLFDLERIEVLKGPQGTLYGRNATAGAINFVTRKPDEEESGYVRVEYGRYDALELRAAYGGAIAESVSARLALYAKTRDGYQNAVSNVGISDGFTSDPDNIPPIPAVAAEDGANESNENAARASLSWSPSHRARVLLTMHVGGTNGMATQDRIRTADPTGFAPPPADIYTVFNNTRDPFESRFTGGALRAELDLDVASITSITGYEQLDRNFGRPDGSPFRITDTTRSEDLRTLTQELRVSSLDPDAPLYWLVGAYYSDDEIDFLNDLDATDLLASVVRTDFVETGRSAALFGQLEWRLATAWKATAGLRFTDEEKRFDGGAIDLDPYGVSNAQAIAPELTPTILASEEFTDSELSGRLALDWQPSDALLAYVSYSRGFKSGGFDGSTFFSPAASEPFDSETLQAYELGAKLRLLDARALVSGAAFYYDYSDQQVQATVEIAEGVTEAVVVNAAQSEIYGLDIEASLRLTGPFRLDLGLSWLESEITEFASADPEEVAALTGNEVPNAPSFGYHIAASVEQPLGNRLSLDGMLGLSHVGDFFRDIGNRDALASDSYSLVSARLGITGTAGWSAYLWGENLTDEEYETYSRVPVGSLIVDQFGSPRTYGVGFSKVF